MWGTVLVLALMAAADPVRFGIAVHLISRPRPMLNLLAFWLGGATTGIAAALAAVLLLRDVATVVVQHVASAAGSGTVRYIQVAGGVLALLIAALIAVDFSARYRARVPTAAGDLSALMLQPSQPGTSTAFSRLSSRALDVLEGRLWVAFVAGLGQATPPHYLLAIAAILASGGAIGAQLTAALMFTVVAFAVVEIPLVSYLATPAKTQAVILQLHTWVRARRRRIFAVILAVTGVLLVGTGMGTA